MTAQDARFVEIYDLYYRRVYAYCRRRVISDRADDAVAEVFLTVWRRIDDVPPGEAALPWLYSVAYRVVGHQWRGVSRARRLEERLMSMGVSEMTRPDDFLVLDDQASSVLMALSKLHATDQEVLRLSVWEELDHEEVALVLGISYEATKKRFSRARRNLAREINRIEEESSPAARKGGEW